MIAGCSDAGTMELELDSSASAEGLAATDCSGLDTITPGNPAVFISLFDDAEAKSLCILSEAQREVVVAHYNIRSQPVLNKLVELHDRGVDVRVVVDKDNAGEDYNTGDDFLEQRGIPVVRMKPGSGQYAIMHLKVAVVDGSTVMTGSFNWNNTAAHANDENMLVFRDGNVARVYRNEVLEVMGAQPRVTEGGKVNEGLEVHFSPEERLDYVARREIDAARSSVDVAMFTFTMYNLADALERAARRGVSVRLVTELKQVDLSDAEERVEAAGGKVIRAANRIGAHSAMHQKFAVIDGRKVITGASNWTMSGTRYNEEDLLVVESAAVAARYRKAFADLLWVYGGEDVTASDPDVLANDDGPVFFQVIHNGTHYGDRVVVVGNHPALGSWNPWQGLDTHTADLWPTWTARTQLPAGMALEYKFVTLKPWGAVQWEGGPNRRLTIPATGRATVVGGQYGNTNSNWTPRN